MVCIHSRVFLSYENNKIMSFIGKWIELEDKMLNKTKQVSCILSHMCKMKGLKKKERGERKKTEKEEPKSRGKALDIRRGRPRRLRGKASQAEESVDEITMWYVLVRKFYKETQ